jgi:hypothetical protein
MFSYFTYSPIGIRYCHSVPLATGSRSVFAGHGHWQCQWHCSCAVPSLRHSVSVTAACESRAALLPTAPSKATRATKGFPNCCPTHKGIQQQREHQRGEKSNPSWQEVSSSALGCGSAWCCARTTARASPHSGPHSAPLPPNPATYPHPHRCASRLHREPFFLHCQWHPLALAQRKERPPADSGDSESTPESAAAEPDDS